MTLPLGFPEPRRVEANGTEFSVHLAGPIDGLPLLMLHGWPELAFSWAPIVEALTGAGCQLIMPDLKGFGGSPGPADPAAYRMSVLAADYEALLDALEIERAVFVGHDWGGAIVWPLAQRIADRGLGVASFCTPYRAVPPAPPLTLMEKMWSDRHYIVQFQDENLPDRVFGGMEADFFRFMFRPGPPRASWDRLMPELTHLPERFAERAEAPGNDVVVPEAALQVYEDAYRRSGHLTPTSLYRAIDLHWEERRSFDPKIGLPALMATASRDVFLPPETSEGMEERVELLTRAEIDSGHWVTWEASEAAAGVLLAWLRKTGLLGALNG